MLPALNEEQTVGKLIKEIPLKILEDKGYTVELVVIDNNSTDNTRAAAEQNGATVIFEPRRGKGNAIKTALRAIEADFIFMLDADYTYPPIYIAEMIEALKQNDVIIGSRLKGKREKGAFTWLNFTGNVLLSLLATIMYQRRISDVCTGYWGFKAAVVKNLCLEHVSGFELEATIFTQIARKGYSLAEIPIYYRRRTGGPPKLKLMRDGLIIALTLIKGRIKSSSTKKTS